MLLLRGKLVSQHIVTSSANKKKKKHSRERGEVSNFHISMLRFHNVQFLSMTESLPLDKALQQAMQHMTTVAHQANILRSAVHTLTI